MHEAQPLVSVLMSSFEHELFIAEAIESVLAQTYRPLELVIVDDASSDATAGVAGEFAGRFPDVVRLHRGRTRRGPCRRRNDALAQARGELVAWLDSDDCWLPEKLELQVAELARDPAVALVYTDWEDVDAHGRPLPPLGSHVLESGDILRALFDEGCFICSSSAVFRRDAMATRGLRFRDADFSFGDDYFLWLGLALDWEAVGIDRKLVRYRRHERNESMRLTRENFHLRRIALLHEFLDAFPDSRDRVDPFLGRALGRQYLRAARFELRSRRPRGAVRSLRMSTQHDAAAPARGVARAVRHARRRLGRRGR